MPRFTNELREAADSVWRAQLVHPFVLGIADGTLDRERFRFWVRQDYLFLIEYCRLFALAAARAPHFDLLLRFADLLQATARSEMNLHRAYANELGITQDELEREQMAPTTRAYTDFLLRIAAMGDYAELVAALLPCMWGFSWLGREMATRELAPSPSTREGKGGGGGAPSVESSYRPAGDPLYARWVEMYADPEFAALADWCRDIVDQLAADAGPLGRARMQDAFVTSSRYELRFWDMAWNHEAWEHPVDLAVVEARE